MLVRTLVLAIALAATTAAVAAADDQPADPLAAEARRRNDELVGQGFNFTHGLSGDAAQAISLVVAPADDPVELALWFAAAPGEVSVRMTGPGGAAVAQWQGARGDLHLTRALPPGRYTVDVAPVAGAKVRGLVGIKGPVIADCKLDPARVVERAPAGGFRWPYLLARPLTPAATTTPPARAAKPALPATLLVAPNNTGFAADDLELLRASARCELAAALAIADRVGTPVLVPLFPRPAEPGSNLYLHALTRAALTARAPAVARVDLQLVAMIDDARALLAAEGTKVAPRVVIAGFSASGSFANRFALLHPDRTRAAIVGSPGGWPLAPVEADGKDRLPYPVGIADVKALTGAPIDRKALAKVDFFFFLGGDDTNDAVPFRDSFSADDEALIMRAFGPTPVARWPAARRLYARARLRATFALYPGVAHQITPAIAADLEAFLRTVVAK